MALNPVRAVRAAWRHSLLMRVVSTTLVLSVAVVALLGMLLLSRVSTGLLNATERAAVAEASAGLLDARRVVSAAGAADAATTPAAVVDSIVGALAARAGSPGQFEILVLSGGSSLAAPERGTNLVSVASVPPDLRAAVEGAQRVSWTYTEIRYLDGRSVPGMVVGGPLTIPGIGPYELYYLFPLTSQQQTLDLVRSAVVGTAVLLVVLVAVIVWVVTRQVVAPVRSAAATAERLASGHLEERMSVRGEDDLARLATTFNEMADSLEAQITQLEQLSLVQQRFVSDVSHELRTPLTTVRMAADVLFESRDDFDPATARAAELLSTQLDRFETLLVDLLEISRHDAGAAVLEAEPVEINGLVRRAVEAAVPLAERHSVALNFDAAPGTCLVNCDPRRVDRILRNLISNAIEHGEAQPVDISIGASADAVAVVVRDRGVGFSQDDAEHVFTRFWRADPARARTTGGTGLGLAIAMEDARLHAGWLEATGAPGRGAVFRLTLPRRPDVVLTESPLAMELDSVVRS